MAILLRCSDVLHVHWNVVNEGGQFALSMVRRLTWYRYIDQWLIVTVIDLKDGYFEIGHHQVSPLLGRREPISAERLRPVDFRCKSFINHVRLPNGQVLQNAMFDPEGMEFIERGEGSISLIGLSQELFSRAIENIKTITGVRLTSEPTYEQAAAAQLLRRHRSQVVQREHSIASALLQFPNDHLDHLGHRLFGSHLSPPTRCCCCCWHWREPGTAVEA